MARQPRTLESMLADFASGGRGDRAELFSTPAMVPVGVDMIEDGAVSFDILHPEVKTNLDDNTKAIEALPETINNAINDANALPITSDRFTTDSIDIWPFVAKTIPKGAFDVGSVTGADLADFALTVKKFKDDRHRLY